MAHFTDVCGRLRQIAAENGNSMIDTASERTQAAEYLKSFKSEVDDCVAASLDEALALLTHSQDSGRYLNIIDRSDAWCSIRRWWGFSTNPLQALPIVPIARLQQAYADAQHMYPEQSVQVTPARSLHDAEPFSVQVFPAGVAAEFTVSYGGGGIQETTVKVRISDAEWQQIIAPFADVHDATDEGVALIKAVAEFEKVIGPKAGTHVDVGGIAGNELTMIDPELRRYARTMNNRKGQQDCVNEAMTTRELIAQLIIRGVLRFHDMDVYESTTSTGGSYYHVGVLLTERESGAKWVLDSWPRDNGEEPDLLPEAVWRKRYASPYEDKASLRSVEKIDKI